MNDKDLISGLKALEERAKLAHRKIEFASAMFQLQRKVEQLEERIKHLEDGRKI